MNTMDALRATDPAAGPVPQVGREELLDLLRAEPTDDPHAARPTPTPANPRPEHQRVGRRRILVGAVAVTAVIAVTTTWQIIGAGHPGGATPAAAALLGRAADAAIGARDPVVGPDQYLHITTDAVTSSGSQLADGTFIGWLDRAVIEQWIPGDPSRDWVLRQGPVVPYRFFTPGDRERAHRLGLLPAARAQSSLTHSQDGAFFGPVTPTWQTPTAAFLASLPRDPAQLLRRIRHDAGDSGQSRDGEALVTIADALRSGIVPADLRAALFRTAQLIPGVRVVDTATNLDGRTGVAVGRDEGHEFRQDIIFDPQTGQVIGERQVALQASGDQPAGTVYDFSAVRTDVVSTTP